MPSRLEQYKPAEPSVSAWAFSLTFDGARRWGGFTNFRCASAKVFKKTSLVPIRAANGKAKGTMQSAQIARRSHKVRKSAFSIPVVSKLSPFMTSVTLNARGVNIVLMCGVIRKLARQLHGVGCARVQVHAITSLSYAPRLGAKNPRTTESQETSV